MKIPGEECEGDQQHHAEEGQYKRKRGAHKQRGPTSTTGPTGQTALNHNVAADRDTTRSVAHTDDAANGRVTHQPPTKPLDGTNRGTSLGPTPSNA